MFSENLETHEYTLFKLTLFKDWIEFEEIADLEERAKSQFFEKVHEEVVLKTQEAAKEKEFQSVPAGPAGSVEVKGKHSIFCLWSCLSLPLSKEHITLFTSLFE